MRQVSASHEIGSEIRDSMGLGSLLLSEVMAGHEIESDAGL